MAVHHPAGRDDVGPRRGLHYGEVGIPFDGGVVVDVSGPRVEDPAVPVVGELVEAAVGHHHQVVADCVLHGLDRTAGDAVGVERRRASGVLVLGPGERKEDHPGEAQTGKPPDLLD